MSTQSLRVKIIPKTIIRGKMDVRFPASVSAESPIILEKISGSYNFTFDMNKVIQSVTFAGFVSGPASAVDGNIPQFDGTTGKLLKDGKAAPTGAIVGTTDTQTLTNKTLTAPEIDSPTGIVKADVGLGNVDNTSDATKNSASATLTNKTIDTATNTFSLNGAAFGTATQATTALNAMVGDSGSGGTKGLVPAPAAGDAAAGKFLTAGGLWAVPAGGGGGWAVYAYNVKAYGATGDGTTDDTAAIQATIDAVIAAGGGVVYFPAASVAYKTVAQITVDLSSITTRYASRIQFRGDGPGRSVIQNTTLADAVIKYTGNSSSTESYCLFEGIRLLGNTVTGSFGLKMNLAAFTVFRGCAIEAFDYAFDNTDIEQIAFYDSEFRYNNHGIRFNGDSVSTGANSLTFINCSISNNAVYGILATHANAFTFVGGSIQYNGTVGGGSGQYGIKIIDAGNGNAYGTVNFIGMAFEGNGGAGDVISDQSTSGSKANFLFSNVAFERTTSFGPTVGYGTNNVSITGSIASKYTFRSCTFMTGSGYTGSSGRPNIANTNASAVVSIDGTNIFSQNVEAPTSQTLYVGEAGQSTGLMKFAGGTSGVVTLKAADAAGTPTLTLPTQTGGLITDGMVREKLTANRTYYVDNTNGNDSNAGLSSGSGNAFKTIQKAINVVAALDISIFNVTIQVADGTYTAGVSISAPWTGSGIVTLQGNTTTPGNVVISTTSGSCITVNSGRLNIAGFKLQTTTSGIGLAATTFGAINVVGLMEYGACATAHIYAERYGVIQITTNYTVSGASPYHLQALSYGYIYNVTNAITITGTPTFVTFAFASRSGTIDCASNTFSGSANGQRYNSTTLASINTFGGGASYFPGSTAGAGTNPGASPYGLYQ